MSWRITNLYLKNNRFIYSGMNKNEIQIDFSKANQNSKLNLLIGGVGSGKTALMGQLQPFATVGTLDNRNSTDQTLDNLDGCKIIEYDHNGIHYKIHHDFIWNKNLKSHSTKSYIEKDGKELNSNGNSGSFKEIIKTEFGLDPSYLRLLRLGSNVENIIKLKPVERKKFIASLREDTEIYLMLHKKLNEDFRILNASINSVSNRLMQLSATDEDKMRDELSSLSKDLVVIMELIKETESKIGKLQGMNQTIGDLSELSDTYSTTEASLESLKIQSENLKIEVDAAKTDETLESISKRIGNIQGNINSLEEKLIKSNLELEKIQTDINKCNDIIAMTENNDHLEDMQKILTELEAEYKEYSIKLSNFKCKYSYHFLSTFIDNLSVLQNMLDEIGQTDPNTLKFIYLRRNKAINTWVTEKVNILTGKRVNLQKAINTVEYSKEYSEPMPLFRAPFCPTDECPYYRTHPSTIQKRSGNKKDFNAKLLRLKDEINRVDAEIAKYQEYPTLQKRLQLLENQWNSTIDVLLNLGVVDNSIDLLEILTDPIKRRDWYQYNHLISILEKTKMHDEYQNVASRYASVKSEMEIIKSPEYESSKYKLEIALKRKEEITISMNQDNVSISAYKEKLSSLENLYHIIQHKDENIKLLENTNKSINTLTDQLDTLNKAIKKVQFNNDQINLLKEKLNKDTNLYNEISQRVDKLKAIISQIEYNQEEYKSLMEDRNTMKAILDAVSSKEGIPLILVKVFLDNCKEIINDLIADVFEDDLEILDFNITETDFKIPYMVNGQYIDDIEYASQGQTSIISIALSFALVQQSIFDYNIMLLDEVDGPLHFSDREKFIGILFKQMAAIHSDQVFMISHSDGIFEGNPVNIIMTSDESFEQNNRQVVTRL